MVEIIIIFALWNKVRDMVWARGHEKTRRYQLLLPLLWFGGQLAGIVLFSVIAGLRGQVQPDLGIAYLWGLVGGLTGLAVLFTRLRNLPRRMLPGEENLSGTRRRSILRS